MKNIERLAKYVTKNGSEHMMIHTVPETGNWIIAEKTDSSHWLLSLANPMGNVTYNLGMVSDKEHLDLWKEITTMEVENKGSQLKQAREIKHRIYKFTRKNMGEFKRFIQSYATNEQSIGKKIQRNRKPRKRN